MNVRLGLLKAFEPAVKFAGRLRFPYSHKLMKSSDLKAILPLLKPGMVLLSRTNGEFSNLLIPGHYTHAAIVSKVSLIGDYKVPMIIEAVGEGVREVDIMSFIFSKDSVMLLAPRFATEDQMSSAADFCRTVLGVPYDYYFEPKADSFYCSELIQKGYAYAMGSEQHFTERKTLGVFTVVPQDYANAAEKFDILWISSGSN